MANLNDCCGFVNCSLRPEPGHGQDDVLTMAVFDELLQKLRCPHHQSDVVAAEHDGPQLDDRISQLEAEKKELELENARTLDENQQLLDQLDQLSLAVADSDIRIRSLEDTLRLSQQAVRRLEGTAARSTDLERHIAALEHDQSALQDSLVGSEAEFKTAVVRWRKAESRIAELQGQLDHMEREAQAERDRHADVLTRFHHHRLRETDARRSASVSAATITTPTIVSQVVRDLLQDNTRLHFAMAELRAMLISSNDELQSLRDQLLFHQPALPNSPPSVASTLRAELGQDLLDPLLVDTPRPPDAVSVSSSIAMNPPGTTDDSFNPLGPTAAASPGLHIHHHYHLSPKFNRQRVKKKRHGITSATFTPPFSPDDARSIPSQSEPSVLVRTPLRKPKLWSVLSDRRSGFASSSGPNSPQSCNRNSVFDPVDALDLSVLPSPSTSIDLQSPSLNRAAFRQLSSHALDDHVIGNTSHVRPALRHNDTAKRPLPPVSHRRLHRAISHESIMSLAGGLDIHTLVSRPSQLTLRPLGSAVPVVTGVIAQPVMASIGDKRGSVVLRDNLAIRPLPALRTPDMSPSTFSIVTSASASAFISNSRQQSSGGGGLSRLVSWRPWGVGSATPSPSPTPALRDSDRRRSGINQPGPVPGFDSYMALHMRSTPSSVTPACVDRDALRDVLEGL